MFLNINQLQCVIILFILFSICLVNCFERSCFKYWDHCLFSYGAEASFSCLTLATAYCKSAHQNSFPLEIVDEAVFNETLNFVSSKYPRMPVVLNAILLSPGNYYWREKNQLLDFVPEEDFTGKACTSNLVFFNKKVRCGHKMTQFGVVCMLPCRQFWRKSDASYESQLYSAQSTLEKCKKVCERDFKCRGIAFIGLHCRTIHVLKKPIKYDKTKNHMKTFLLDRNMNEDCLKDLPETPKKIVGSCVYTVPQNYALALLIVLLTFTLLIFIAKLMISRTDSNWATNLNTVMAEIRDNLRPQDYRNARLRSVKNIEIEDYQNVARLSLEIEKKKNSRFLDAMKKIHMGRHSFQQEMDDKNIEELREKIAQTRKKFFDF